MQPEAAKFLLDMQRAAEAIQDYMAGKTRDEYLRNKALRDAVYWNLAIIGEALGQLHRAKPDVAERIGEWKRVIAFRNQLIHGYGVIQHEITWDIIQNKLPRLLADVTRLLAE